MRRAWKEEEQSSKRNRRTSQSARQAGAYHPQNSSRFRQRILSTGPCPPAVHLTQLDCVLRAGRCSRETSEAGRAFPVPISVQIPTPGLCFCPICTPFGSPRPCGVRGFNCFVSGTVEGESSPEIDSLFRRVLAVLAWHNSLPLKHAMTYRTVNLEESQTASRSQDASLVGKSDT
jgi:hypothetical protein